MVMEYSREATRQELIEEIDRLQEKNEELQNQVDVLDEAYSGSIKESKKWFDIAHDSIPKSVIQDKIKRLYEEDRQWTDELEEPDFNYKIIDKNLKRIKNQIDILEEVLKEGKI